MPRGAASSIARRTSTSAADFASLLLHGVCTPVGTPFARIRLSSFRPFVISFRSFFDKICFIATLLLLEIQTDANIKLNNVDMHCTFPEIKKKVTDRQLENEAKIQKYDIDDKLILGMSLINLWLSIVIQLNGFFMLKIFLTMSRRDDYSF